MVNIKDLRKQAESLNQDPSINKVFDIIVQICQILDEKFPTKETKPATADTVEPKKRGRKKKNV